MDLEAMGDRHADKAGGWRADYRQAYCSVASWHRGAKAASIGHSPRAVCGCLTLGINLRRAGYSHALLDVARKAESKRNESPPIAIPDRRRD
jgi:hypothetical protein